MTQHLQNSLADISQEIEQAQNRMRTMLMAVDRDGGLTKERYQRFLSMQYHLTKGVQRHFFKLAGHPDVVRKGILRDFLVRFAIEEEPHFELAKKDLEELALPVLPMPLDVKCWWLFFDDMIDEKPFYRLGATCILENIAHKSSEIVKKWLKESSFLNPKNSVFLIVHQHETLPHGDQILSALEKAGLSNPASHDLAEGARIAQIFYFRMLSWVFAGSVVTTTT